MSIPGSTRGHGLWALGLALFIAAPAYAAWVPAGTPICTAAGDMFRPAIAPDGSGGAYIAWEDWRSGGTQGVFMQHEDAWGNAQWVANGFRVCTDPSNEFSPAVIADGAGGVIVVWQDDRTAGESDLFAQRLDGSGARRWAAGGVLVRSGPGYAHTPVLCPDGAGGAIVAWNVIPGSSCVDTCSQFFVQHLTAAGTRGWPGTGGVAIYTARGGIDSPSLVTDHAGGAIVVWGDQRNGDPDVFAQRVNSSGAMVWAGSGVPVCVESDAQSDPAAAVLDIGVLVTWDDYRFGDAPYAYGQALDLSGTALAVDNGIPIAPGQSDQFARALQVADGALIAFMGAPNIQKVDTDGVLQLGSSGVPLRPSCQGALAPVIVTDGGQGAIVFWQGSCDFVTYNLRAQRVNSMGTAQWVSDGLAMGPSAYGQAFFAAIADGQGGAIAAWEDQRNGGFSIYAQKVTGGGVVAPTTGVGPGAPARAFFAPPYPNPARGRTELDFSLGAAGRVDVDVLDVSGRLVRHLAEAERFEPGEHALVWDGRDDAGQSAPAGLYLARVRAAGGEALHRIVMLR